MLKLLTDGRIVYSPSWSNQLSQPCGLDEGTTVADIIREEAYQLLYRQKLAKARTQVGKRVSKSRARLWVVEPEVDYYDTED